MRSTRSTVHLALIAGLALASGCTGDAPTSVAPETASLKKAPAPPPNPIVVEDIGFAFPESALHDEKADVYLVSNVGAGDLLALDNNGFITRLAPDGSVLTLKWIEGTAEHPLHGPTGLVLVGNVLYVVDREAVKLYSGTTGEWLGVIPFPKSVSLLNDICVGNRNTLYVTDTGLSPTFAPTGTDAIYQIRNGKLSIFAQGTWLNNPNGCITNGANVIVTSFDAAGGVYRVNPSGKKHVTAEMPEDAGQNDSVLRVGGFLYVTSWEASAVYRMSMGGGQLIKILDLGTPADLGYDAKRDRLLVPSLFGNVLVIQPL